MVGCASELYCTSFKLKADTISGRAMMRFIHVAAAVLSFLSVGQSAPVTDCDSLIQPLEIKGREQLQGKWIQVAESTDSKGAEMLLKKFRDSFWLKITAGNESDDVVITGSSKAFDFCITVTIKTTLENSTLRPSEHGFEREKERMDEEEAAFDTVPETEPDFLGTGYKESEEVFAETSVEKDMINVTMTSTPQVEESVHKIKLFKTGCPDCLLLHPAENVLGGTLPAVKGLLLLSKRRTVTAAELEEFKKQAECLNLQQPFSLNPKGDICPEPPSQDTESLDVPRLFVNSQLSDFENLYENITSSFDGRENFIKVVTQIMSKEN